MNNKMKQKEEIEKHYGFSKIKEADYGNVVIIDDHMVIPTETKVLVFMPTFAFRMAAISGKVESALKFASSLTEMYPAHRKVLILDLDTYCDLKKFEFNFPIHDFGFDELGITFEHAPGCRVITTRPSV